MTLQLFKGLVALMVMVCIPWLLESFRNLRKSDYQHSEEHLRERIQEIYANVTLFYNRLDTLRQTGELAPTAWPDFDAQYCTDDWRAMVAAVTAADEGCPDGQGFFSWNYWTCAADMDFTYVSNVEVIDKTGDRGTASLVVHHGTTATPVLLCMRFEHGDWRIDDITSNWQLPPSTHSDIVFPTWQASAPTTGGRQLRHYEWKQEMKNYLGVLTLNS